MQSDNARAYDAGWLTLTGLEGWGKRDGRTRRPSTPYSVPRRLTAILGPQSSHAV